MRYPNTLRWFGVSCYLLKVDPRYGVNSILYRQCAL